MRSGGCRHARELDEPPVRQLEHAPVDRLVRAAGLFDDGSTKPRK
jgi:hypothetical protein